ncbi:MAG: BspA family leucine-rich repeat surface protein [Bacilli bacterium]|nr:BspA family leucine-rich repeat surface protein [Bacilli bacterium]
MICPNCHSNISGGTVTCPICNQIIQAQTVEQPVQQQETTPVTQPPKEKKQFVPKKPIPKIPILIGVGVIIIIIGIIVSISATGNKDVKNDKKSAKYQPTNGYDCIFEGKLEAGTSFTNGQYTYHYKQQSLGMNKGWEDIKEDGWGVILNDKASKSSITSKICGSINHKPIVSMKYMFSESNAESIDLNNIDTSQVVNMDNMFEKANIKVIDLSHCDMGKVKSMKNMFLSAKTETVYVKDDNSKKKLENIKNNPKGLVIEIKK